MVHPLVSQLQFSRSEFRRVFEGVTEEEATTRLGQMNCLSWIVGHLAAQEQSYWVITAQGADSVVDPDLNALVGYGSPPSTPPLGDMWNVWEEITLTADRYLNGLDSATLTTTLERDGQPMRESVGTMILRTTHHYWFHLGEAHAIRQQLGHQDLPMFVGSFGDHFYYPEAD